MVPDVRRNGGPPAPVARPDRLPPQNLEAEQSVLGSILIDNAVLDEVVTFLAPSDFYRDSHQIAYGRMLELYRAGKAVDVITLAELLERTGELARVGGDEALGRWVDTVPHTVNAKLHAQIVKQKSIGRALIETANEILQDGYAQNRTAEELVELAERRVFAIADSSVTDSTVTGAGAIAAAISRVTSRGTALVGGIPTGLTGLDALVDGFTPEQLWVLAARPSMGKTALALNMAEAVALKSKRGVLFVSLEMGRVELGERLLVGRSLVENWKLRRTDALRPDEWAALTAAHEAWEKAPLHIDDNPERTTLQVMAHARRIKSHGDLGVIFVDYLQLLSAPEGSRDSRQELVARFSRELKRVARALKVTVVALSQLNRASEGREDRRPRMADLRESGAIEQDADVVLLLHRPEYYNPEDRPGEAELIVAKNRNGATGDVPLDFVKQMGRFTDHADAAPPPAAAF
jgi:replicative DNA helicase